mmetsp:Transcript_44395/g.87748  ORF Transcript_44395/g.87748 Transcript_44395/m.87748 type:complete len:96 (-) Transcript_44395:3150-3437(-)
MHTQAVGKRGLPLELSLVKWTLDVDRRSRDRRIYSIYSLDRQYSMTERQTDRKEELHRRKSRSTHASRETERKMNTQGDNDQETDRRWACRLAVH